MRPRSLAVAAALLVIACTPPEQDEGALSGAVAEELADGADRLAGELEQEDHCAALAEADALDRQVRAAAEAGDAPPEVVTETVRVVTELTTDLRCEPDDADDAEGEGDDEDAADADEGADQPDDGGDDEPSSGRGNGGGPPDHARGNPGGGR